MRVLLVYPQYIYHDTFDSRSPSLSLLYLAARLEQDGHEARIFDASQGPLTPVANGFRYGMSDAALLQALQDEQYDLIGITGSFASRWPFVAKLASLFKSIWPATPIIIGGLFPTYAWEYCLQHSRDLDAVVLGEGEETLAEIVRNLEQGRLFPNACESVEGVAWRANGQLKKNDKRGYIENLDCLPYPAWHLLDLERFFKAQGNFYELRPPFFTVLSSRSCPEACSFCNMYITHGRKWRARAPENFVDELEYLRNTFKVSRFFIADDNFSFNLERAKNICREILRRKLHIRYNTGNGLHIKRVDRELFELMKASGCGSIALAIESGSERIRNEVYRKRLPTEKIFQAVQWCHEVGLPVIGFFMVGAPGENRESVAETKKLIAELPLTLCTCSIYTPYPRTTLYDVCIERGYLQELAPENEMRVEFVTGMLTTPDFSPEDVKAWQREIYVHFIKHHWRRLGKELLRPHGIIHLSNFSMLKRLFAFKKW